jgi:hypothetical protein
MQPSVPDVVPPPGGSSGILGSIFDLWKQAQNPYAGPEALPTGPIGAAAPPGAGPPAAPGAIAPPAPTGYLPANPPGAAAPASGTDAGAPAARPTLPPGYYSLDGPPPPWLVNPAAPAPGPAVPAP